jgi:hypothetical protein
VAKKSSKRLNLPKGATLAEIEHARREDADALKQAASDLIAKKKRLTLEFLSMKNTLAEACSLSGARVLDVIKWRREDLAFAADFRDVSTAVAIQGDEPEALIQSAYLACAKGNASMLQFMLSASMPTIYDARIRALAFIDDQARAAANAVAEITTSESASIIIAHLNKLAAEKAGLANAASS